MSVQPNVDGKKIIGVVFALGEQPLFQPGDAARILTRSPVGHYRVPTYLRGKVGTVEAVIEPAAVDNEQEGFGLNAGRIAIPMTEIWPDYIGSTRLSGAPGSCSRQGERLFRLFGEPGWHGHESGRLFWPQSTGPDS